MAFVSRFSLGVQGHRRRVPAVRACCTCLEWELTSQVFFRCLALCSILWSTGSYTVDVDTKDSVISCLVKMEAGFPKAEFEETVCMTTLFKESFFWDDSTLWEVITSLIIWYSLALYFHYYYKVYGKGISTKPPWQCTPEDPILGRLAKRTSWWKWAQVTCERWRERKQKLRRCFSHRSVGPHTSLLIC